MSAVDNPEIEMFLVEIAAKAAHVAYCQERQGGKLHAPEDCPNGNDCVGCRGALRPWEKLTEAAREGFRRQAQPIVVAFTARLEQFLAQFPDDATSWAYATDELPDMDAWLAKQLGIDETRIHRATCTPSEWNQKYKAAIRTGVWQLNDEQRTAFEERFKCWLDEIGGSLPSVVCQAPPPPPKCSCPSWVDTVADLLSAEAKPSEHAIEVTERLISESKAYARIKAILQGQCLPNETYVDTISRLVRYGKLNPILDVDILAALERLEDKKREEMGQLTERVTRALSERRTDGLNEFGALKELAHELHALRTARKWMLTTLTTYRRPK